MTSGYKSMNAAVRKHQTDRDHISDTSASDAKELMSEKLFIISGRRWGEEGDYLCIVEADNEKKAIKKFIDMMLIDKIPKPLCGWDKYNGVGKIIISHCSSLKENVAIRLR